MEFPEESLFFLIGRLRSGVSLPKVINDEQPEITYNTLNKIGLPGLKVNLFLK